MIGNTKGWLLAGVVFAAEVGAVAYALSLDRTSPATAVSTADGALEPIALPVDPRTILRPDRPGDAGARYRAAAAAYLADAARYETFLRDRAVGQVDRLDALDELLAATRLEGDAIFAGSPDAAVVYGESLPVQALRQVGMCAIAAAQLVDRRNDPAARARYEAAFSLGLRLFDERLTYRQMFAGIELMSASAAGLAAQARRFGRADELAALTRFADAQRDHVRDRLTPTFAALHTMNPGLIARHNGDVFRFARDGRERVWRVEAILKLGRMKYHVGDPGSPGDQRHAARLASRYAEAADDPVIRRAATLARDLTVEQFRTLR